MRIRILDSGKLLHVESGILDFGIRNTAQRIRNPTNDYNPESKYESTTDKESGIQYLDSAFQDCLVKFPYMGREIEYTPARSLS